ncbi:MAG: hypothetical protein LBO65_00900 [Spirochaetaceae bacterium]|jgi:class 3 adenylate cyclase|nr:hypothetical protein [Spirochaetaceae bacterium]
METEIVSRRRGVLPALLWLFLASCDPFTHDPAAFFEEQTGGITLGLPAVVDGTLALGTDGYICLKAGETGFSIPLDNPLGYELIVESSFNQTLGTGISGLTVTQQDLNHLAVDIPSGSAGGDEGTLHIKIKTAAEGRILYEGDLGIAYFADFDTSLTAITPSDPLTLNEVFSPDSPNYSISEAPASFTLSATAAKPAALITINGGTGLGSLERTITPNAAISEILIRVELRHGAAARNYSVVVNRKNSGDGYLDGRPKHATIFFSDIRGFTEKSENFTRAFGEDAARRIVRWLNEYFTQMAECVTATGGVVDKFIEDAVMAHWGTVYTAGSPEEDAFNCVKSALMMRLALVEMNKDRSPSDPANPPVRIGCGINTGIVVAGQIGSGDRMEYTVIGDPVNIASRIVAMNEVFGTDILIAEDTWMRINKYFITEEMPSITGKTKPIRIFAVINFAAGAEGPYPGPQTLQELQEFLLHF